MKGFPQVPVFHKKIETSGPPLEEFTGVSQKGWSQKMEVLARIYFSITG
jgi:hypothetical protein